MKKTEIWAKWRTYGWFAFIHDWPSESRVASGPRCAAEYLADEIFGRNNYVLRFVTKGRYEAVRKEAA